MITASDFPPAGSGRLELARRQAADLSGLDLASLGAGTREEKIGRIAAQFEEMLIQTLIKTMEAEEKREGSETGIGLGASGDLRRMFLSQYVAGSGGLGYAELIRAQLAEKLGPDPALAASAGGGSFHLTPARIAAPVSGAVTSAYGWRSDPLDGAPRFHAGVDLRAPAGSPVHAFMDGTVTFSGWRQGYGHLVEIAHDNGLVTRYGHNSQPLVQAGQRVAAGAVVARSGSSGRSTGPHLHFEVRREGQPLDAHSILAAIAPNVQANSADLWDVMA